MSPNYYSLMILSLMVQILPCSSRTFSINEEAPLGTSVGFIVDGRNHGSVYHLEPKDGLFKFSEAKPTLVVTNSTIDKEELCPYEERCRRVYDVMTDSTNQKHLTRITIIINDINDHIPEFPPNLEQPIVISIPETFNPGSKGHRLPNAEDPDQGSNGNITYSFVSSKTSPAAMAKFSLAKHVIDDVTHVLSLTLNDRLDRETEDEYNLTIMAEDGGTPRRSSILRVKVQVLDHNDNSPQFERSYYSVDVNEDLVVGEEVVVLRASDADYGENARIKYSWSDDTSRSYGHLFSIDSTSGSVKLKSGLDREEQPTLHLTAIASDFGTVLSLSSHALLTVNVRDVNDNPPSITLRSTSGQVTDELEIAENSVPETILGKLSVSDKDQGNNGRVSCTVYPPIFFLLPSPKRINTVTPSSVEYDLLTGGQLDRENNSQVDISITCSDDGKPPLRTYKMVKLKVLDVNDNAPVFEKNVYRMEVDENTPIGTKIFQIKATDEDEGLNAKLTYNLEPQQAKWNDILRVDENGDVITLNTINCEENSQMMFMARASDSGIPNRIGEAGLEVTVRDKDEHIPIFDRTSYEFSTHSKIPENFLLGQVRAIDEDCSTRFGKVIYRLEDTYRETVEHLLYVDKNSGEIRSRVPLDKSRNVRFSVLPGNPSGRWFPESKVDVVIRLVVEESSRPLVVAPIFHFPNDTNNSVILMVGSDNGTAVCQLQLTNSSIERARKLMRSGSKNLYRFSILSGNEEGLLSIDESTGWIKTTSVLNSAGQLVLNVSAYNPHNNHDQATSLLVVQVTKHDAMLSDQSSLAATILDHSVLIAILLACSAFLLIFCITVVVIRCHLSKRRRRPRRYNCRLETVKAASNGSLNKGAYLTPDLNACSTFKDSEQNSDTASSLHKFNNRFVSFNVDDDLSCHTADPRIACPFRDNCSLHKPFVPSDFDEMSYLNERDFYNLPVFSTQTTSLYSTQKSLPDENQLKSFKPLRASPIDRPPSSSSGLRQLSPTSFFPITCSGHMTSCQGSSLSGFNYINNNCSSKDVFGHARTPSAINDRRQSESQI